MARNLSALLLPALLFCAGCASVKVKHVGECGITSTSEGVHFFRPRPYLLVSVQKKKDAAGTESNEFSSSIVWLPDHSQEYVVQVESGWGSVDGSVELANGWMLSKFGAKSDSKGPETIAAISGLVKEAAAAAGSAPPQGLYRIDIDMQGNVTLVKQTNW